MKKLLLLILLLTSPVARAEAPVIWDGNYVLSLADPSQPNAYEQANGYLMAVCTADPSVAGFVAPINSICQGANALWFKFGAGNTQWTNMLTGSSGWSLTGNAGTNSAVNFMGTLDAQDVVFKANNSEVYRIIQGTNVLKTTVVGSPSPGTTSVQIDNTHGTAGDEFGLLFSNSGFAAANARITNRLNAGGGSSQMRFYMNGTLAEILDENNDFYPGADGAFSLGTSASRYLNVHAYNGIFYTSMQLEDPGAGTNKVTVQAPAALAAPYTMTLPPDMGTNNYVLSTNGVSTTSWQSVAALANAWSLLGNAGTNDAVNFMGTTDAQDVVFKANNSEVMRIEETGQSLLVGTTAPAPFAISAIRTATDPAGQSGGIFAQHTAHLTVNGSNINSAIYARGLETIDAGVTESGAIAGVIFAAERNNGADAGNLAILAGAFGGANQISTSGTTTTATGYLTQQNFGTGSITNAYDFYALPASLGSTITNRYGIYVSPDVPGKINYLADRLAVGASYTAPTHTLEVQNGEMTQNKAATDTTAVGALFTDSTHTTVNGSNNAVGIQTSVSAVVDAGALNDKVAGGTVNTVTRGDGTDDGTLEEVNGDTSIMFINSGAAGITNKVVGFDVATILQQGTVVDLYDFRSVTVPAGGTATNQYGIYLGPGAGGVKQSWLADRTVLGSTSFSAPNTSLDVNGDIAWRMTADASVGVVTALSTTSTSAIRLTGAGAVTLQGIAGGVDGKILTLSNQTGAVLTVANQNGGAGATDRIITGTGASMSIADDAALILQYDATQQRWLVIAAPSSGGGGGGTASVKFTLSGAVVPYEAIDGVHYQTTVQSLTNVYVSALNSGTAGTTVVRVNQYRAGALIDSQTASLASNAGLPDGSFAALSGTLSLQVGDIISVDVDSAAAGASELSVEY